VTGREAMRPHNRWLPPPLYYCLAKWSGAKTIHTRYIFFSFSLLVVVDDSATNDKDTRLREMGPAKSKTSYESVFFSPSTAARSDRRLADLFHYRLDGVALIEFGVACSVLLKEAASRICFASYAQHHLDGCDYTDPVARAMRSSYFPFRSASTNKRL
jgi:hypothetical protein